MRKLPLRAPLVWHSYLLGGILGLLASLWLFQALAGLFLLLFVDRRLWTWQRLSIACLIFALACLFAANRIETGQRITHTLHTLAEWQNKPGYRFCGIVTSTQGLPENRLKILLEDVAPPGEKPLPGLCAWTWDSPLFAPLPGQKICLKRSIRPVSAFANSSANSYLASLFSQDIYWRAWSRKSDGDPQAEGQGNWIARLRHDLQQNFLTLLKPDNGSLNQSEAILPALLFGDRRYLKQTTLNNFASATLAHSLALSGQHLAIAGLFGMILVISLAKFRPEIFLAQPKKLWLVLAAVPFAILYLWLGNAPASLVRAAGMLFFASLCLLSGRAFSGQDLLCATLLLILTFNPLAIFNISLQLSALCVAVILLALPALAKLLPANSERSGDNLLANLKLILAISLLIQISLLPLSLQLFQNAGFWFPLNVLWLPLLGLIVLPCAFAALAFSCLPWQLCHYCALALIKIAVWPCSLLDSLLDFLSQHKLLAEPAFLLPTWPSLLAFALLSCLLAWFLGSHTRTFNARKSRFLLGVCIFLLAIGPAQRLHACFDQKTTIEALDVGQGQAILVSLPGPMRIIIDGGGSYTGSFDVGKLVLAPLLATNVAPALAAVINSHPDADHLGGLFHILNNFQLEKLFHNGRDAARPEQWKTVQLLHSSHALGAGDRILLGNAGWRLDVLYPPKNRPELAGNSASLVLRLSLLDKGIAIFPGDMEKTALQALLDQGDLNAQIAFAPHHGSDKNFLPAFYTSIDPEIVIACCGYLNRWNYPGKKLRAWLARNHIPLFATSTSGKVKVTIEKDSIKVTTIKHAETSE